MHYIVRYNMNMQLSRHPTQDIYSLLQMAYDRFNQELFASEISRCMITMQREKKTMGFFSENRWAHQSGQKNHEIALNPSYFVNYPLSRFFRPMVHEMCHLYQFEFGKPSFRTYHNKEWADLVEGI